MSVPDEQEWEEASRAVDEDSRAVGCMSDEELAQELAARLVSKAVSNAHTPHSVALTVKAEVPGALPMSIALAPGIHTSFLWEQLVMIDGAPVRITVPMVAVVNG